MLAPFEKYDKPYNCGNVEPAAIRSMNRKYCNYLTIVIRLLAAVDTFSPLWLSVGK